MVGLERPELLARVLRLKRTAHIVEADDRFGSIATQAITATGPFTSAMYPEPDGGPTTVGPPFPLRVSRPIGGRGSSNGQHRAGSDTGPPLCAPRRVALYASAVQRAARARGRGRSSHCW